MKVSVIINKLDSEYKVDKIQKSLGMMEVEIPEICSSNKLAAISTVKQIVQKHGAYVYGYYVVMFWHSDITVAPIRCSYRIFNNGAVSMRQIVL